MRAIRNKGICTAALMSSAAMAVTLGSAPALAQDAAESADSNTIVVTAQRRSQLLEDVPMTVAVVTPESLANSGVNSVRDLQNVTSGFMVNNAGNTPQPAIRGITTTNAGPFENNVALYVDGLYQVAPQVLNMDLPNVQDIQILKGPQGTLYGRNATGGAILINTVDPTDTWQGLAEATYGRFNDRRARAFVAGPLSDTVGISLAGTLRHTDGYYKKASRTTPGQFDGRFLGIKQESLRAKLKFDLSDTFTVTAGYNYLRAEDPRAAVFAYVENVLTPYTGTTGNATRPRGLGEAAGDVFKINAKVHEGSLKLELDTGLGQLRSITGYSVATNDTAIDFGGSYVPDQWSDSLIRDKTWQQSVEFDIDAMERLDLVVGGNYFHIKTDISDPNIRSFAGPASLGLPFPDPAVAIVPLSDYRQQFENDFFRTKKAWAAFADATFQATDRLSITVGGRYSKETQNVSATRIYLCSSPAAAPCTPIGGATSVPYTVDGLPRAGFTPTFGAANKSSTYNKFTPRGAIRFELSPGSNVYASYSKGFRSGEWSTAIPFDNPANWFDVGQESVDAYEIGFKTAGSRLRFELSGFYYDYSDLQVSNTQLINNLPTVVLVNAPKARIYGVEGNFDYKLTDNFTVRGGATWLDAKYGDDFFFNGPGICLNTTNCPSVSTPGFNTNSDPLRVFTNKQMEQNLSGLEMARAPKFTGFLGFDYLVPKGDGGLRLAANLKYTTSYVVTNPAVFGGDPRTAAQRGGAAPDNSLALAGTPYADRANEQRFRQSGFVLLNASITWTDSTDNRYIRIWGNNLTNEKYRTHYTGNALGNYSPIGEPLTFGGTIGYKF